MNVFQIRQIFNKYFVNYKGDPQFLIKIQIFFSKSIIFHRKIIRFFLVFHNNFIKIFPRGRECDFHEEDLQVSNTTIKLLQIAELKTDYVIQCKIEIRRTIYHCEMFSHLGSAENGLQEYLYDVSVEQGKFIYNMRIFKYDNFYKIANIKIN